MDKLLRNAIIIGILTISLSAGYYFFWMPFKRNYDLKKCLNISENTLVQRRQEISSHVDYLKKQEIVYQQEAEEKLKDFLKNNPEPPKSPTTLDKYIKGGTFFERLNRETGVGMEHYNWVQRREEIFNTVKDTRKQVINIEADFGKIEKEKREADDVCYKKFK